MWWRWRTNERAARNIASDQLYEGNDSRHEHGNDAQARDRFRKYWSYVAPGVALSRLALLRPLKHEAERRFLVERGLEAAEVPDVTIRTVTR